MMILVPTLLTFVLYFLLLLGIGFFFYKRSTTIEDYLLGGRGMGTWVTAFSAQASDMSGWLMMGLPGAVYLAGIEQSWIAIGLFLGTVLNWKLVSARLRVYTKLTGSITLPCFFEDRFRDPTGLLRIVSAIIIMVFFAIYASSGLMAAGKLFESIFAVNYQAAVLIGGAIIIVYTFLGGFLAVCWTDLIQGSLMVCAIVIVPAVAYGTVGGAEAVSAAMAARGISASLFVGNDGFSLLRVVSALAWGFGYFGQPHILTRFMSIKSINQLPRAMTIAVSWVFLSLTGAVVAGLVAIPMFDPTMLGDPERVFILMISQIFNPWIGGVFLAAIFSAIMSTIDSQLLVSSSALTEDFYNKAIKKDASGKEVMLVGRICVVIISVVALLLALKPDDTILGVVAYAWGGFGAAFGPLVLFALFSEKTTWKSALAGMVTGTVMLILWKQLGLGAWMYEIVPGFIANCGAVLAVNTIVRQDNQEIIREYLDVVKTVKQQSRPR